MLVEGSVAVVRWIFEFEWLDGTATHMEEQFFYDPSQVKPAG